MFKNILKGLKAYKDGLEFIGKLRLWEFFLVPMVISFVLFGIIILTAWGLSDNLGGYVASMYPFEWGSGFVITVSEIVAFLSILLVGLVLFKHLVLAFSAPFMSPVSERIEKHLCECEGIQSTHRQTTNMEQLARGLRVNMRNLIYEFCMVIPLTLLSFIPVVGIVFVILSFFIQAYYAGFGNMDYTLERHFNYRDSVNYVKANRGIAVGNGLVFMGMLFIPVIGIILVLPFSVTAASRVTLEKLIAENRLNHIKLSPSTDTVLLP
ncbi:MAG: EI24 domain-containing protein [Nonlabens sp.]|nr:EI24 domain-containing protein [Nonlabens sp.]